MASPKLKTQEYAKYECNEAFAEKWFKKHTIPKLKTLGKNGFKYMFNKSKCEIHKDFKEKMDCDLKAVANFWDCVYLFCGREGCGKSFGLGLGCATYISFILKRPFDSSSIVFTPKQFMKKWENAKRGEVIVWDEFMFGGSNDKAMTEMQNTLIDAFTTKRNIGAIIILIMPYFHMAREYFAVSRSRVMINAISPDGITRGTAKVYGYKRKNYAYYSMRKRNDKTLSKYKHDFVIKFLDLSDTDITEHPVIDFDDYDLKKSQSNEEFKKEQSKPGNSFYVQKYKGALNKLILNLESQQIYKSKELESITGLGHATIWSMIKKPEVGSKVQPQ